MLIKRILIVLGSLVVLALMILIFLWPTPQMREAPATAAPATPTTDVADVHTERFNTLVQACLDAKMVPEGNAVSGEVKCLSAPVVEQIESPSTLLPSTQVPTATVQSAQIVGTGCPTEAEFEVLVGVRADIDRTEPCTFHWRGDPKTLGATHPSPLGWISTLGVDSKNYVYIGDDGLAPLEIFSGTWRMVSIFPAGDAVYDKCAFLLKVQYEGQISSPQWTAEAGNFVCP